MLLQAVNHSFQSLWWRDYELALAGNRTQTLILLSKLRALSCSGTLGNKIVSTCLAYWFSQRFFCLLVALYVFKCLSFEPNLINYLKTLLNLFLVFFSSIFCHEVTDIDENMSVNSHVISSKYTHAHNIHLYPCILILKSKVVHSVLLIVSGLLMVLKWNRFMCGTKKKKSPFLGDADHVSENHDPERAGCGGSVQIMGDADICTADMMRVHHKGLGQKNWVPWPSDCRPERGLSAWLTWHNRGGLGCHCSGNSAVPLLAALRLK